jgi:hypothetical protein
VIRPRFTISILRGLISMHSLAYAELQGMERDELRAYFGGAKGERDYDRAAEWLIRMRHWYKSREVKR